MIFQVKLEKQAVIHITLTIGKLIHNSNTDEIEMDSSSIIYKSNSPWLINLPVQEWVELKINLNHENLRLIANIASRHSTSSTNEINISMHVPDCLLTDKYVKLNCKCGIAIDFSCLKGKLDLNLYDYMMILLKVLDVVCIKGFNLCVNTCVFVYLNLVFIAGFKFNIFLHQY